MSIKKGKKRYYQFVLYDLIYIKIILKHYLILLFYQNYYWNMKKKLYFKKTILSNQKVFFLTLKNYQFKFLFIKEIYNYIKNYNNILIIPDLEKVEDLNFLIKILEEKKCIISGFLIKKKYILKEDLNLKLMDKKQIYILIKKQLYNHILIFKKILLILKKKNGNNKSNIEKKL